MRGRPVGFEAVPVILGARGDLAVEVVRVVGKPPLRPGDRVALVRPPAATGALAAVAQEGG
jgi:hypothetical protein